MASDQTIPSHIPGTNVTFKDPVLVSPDLSSPFMSRQVYTTVLTIFNVAVVPAISVFGITGNVTTMLVLYRMGFKDTTQILLFSLAICDFLFLILACIRRMETFLYFVDAPMAKAYAVFVLVYTFALTRMFMSISVLHIPYIAIERFVAVFYPFKVSLWITKKRMIISLLILYISMFIFFLPLLVGRLKIQWVLDRSINQTVPEAAFIDFYKEHKNIVQGYISGFIIGVLGFSSQIIVCTCSVAVSVKLFQANKKHRTMSALSDSDQKSQRTKEMRVSRMLLTVCLVYITTNFPTYILLFIMNRKTEIPILTQFYDFTFAVTEVCNVINSSVNFVIYVFLSSKFYETLKGLACC